jgi:hypothetical protein
LCRVFMHSRAYPTRLSKRFVARKLRKSWLILQRALGCRAEEPSFSVAVWGKNPADEADLKRLCQLCKDDYRRAPVSSI